MSAQPLNPLMTPAEFEQRLGLYPARRRETRLGSIGYREAGLARAEATPVVLLHGIGSGAASWVQQLESLAASRRVVAWDAPGYGVSTPVAARSPVAIDYAEALSAWLDALGFERCVLVGHSLGAIVAGAFAAVHPSSVAGLLLVSPAAGYGAAQASVRESKRDARLAMIDELGPQSLADQRSGNMLSADASDAARGWVRWNMSRVIPDGYRQATHLLANADLASDVARYSGTTAGPAVVAVGEADVITPPAACEPIAQAARTKLQIIPRAGHAGYIECPDAYTALIDSFCLTCDEQRSN